MEKQLINTDKLYSVIGKFFTHKDNLMFELIQNAARAKATRVEINAPYILGGQTYPEANPDNLLRIRDNGQGITDIVALLGIAISDWDKDIDQQEPAGMGFLQLLALSRQVYIKSKFGELTLDSQRFLQEHDYRMEVVNADFQAKPDFIGTLIIADMLSSAFFYLKSDYSWYAGYRGIRLTINDKEIEPITLDKLADVARQKKNLCYQVQYMGNPLLIEIGEPGMMVGNNKSCVNWYGQLIPCGFGIDYYLSSTFIRYYYEVSHGTPLTPRYPDRTVLALDDKWDAFNKFLVESTTQVLADYFTNWETSHFRNWTEYHLLQFLYRHADKSVLDSLKWVPVGLEAFTSQDHYNFGIMEKAELKENGYVYCTTDLLVNDDYYLGFDLSMFKCVKVTDKVSGYLKEAGLYEVSAVRSVNLGQERIQLEPLVLEFIHDDQVITALKVYEVLLYNHSNDIYIIAPEVGKVLDVFNNYWDDVADYNADASVEEQEETIRNEIWYALTHQYNLMPDDRFDFLPRHRELKTIAFQEGNLAVSYRDGSTLNFSLRG
jgi:hypothetical protein